uniref:HAT C-terminal dimerisation domain-containing protein n=1 Tax=Lactuca sativa TaxID=4236 RepID=A0A9R1V4W4_LACSA|nr:hypothetical protein LSAT_V11C700368370 [Lactuca sativa]
MARYFRISWKGEGMTFKFGVKFMHVIGEQSPVMVFIYGAMDECKEKIAKNFDNEVSSYKEIWDIIDEKWEHQMHRDLHAAAYYLNSEFRWSPNVSQHPKIKRGLYNCMNRLIKSNDIYMKIEAQPDDYKYQKGTFGCRASLNSYMKRVPVTWWGHYGDEVPELQAFTMKILGLTCSVHTKRRNRLSTNRMNNLVYIMSNKKLMQKFIRKTKLKDSDNLLVVDEVLSDNEWIANPSDEYDEACEEDEIDVVCREIRERGESSSSRKRKNVEQNSVDEDDVD